jgi:hypothetical protein
VTAVLLRSAIGARCRAVSWQQHSVIFLSRSHFGAKIAGIRDADQNRTRFYRRANQLGDWLLGDLARDLGAKILR